MKGITCTPSTVFIEPSSVWRILRTKNDQIRPKSKSPYGKSNITEVLSTPTVTDENLKIRTPSIQRNYASLWEEAGQVRSISCISALYLNLHLKHVPIEIGKRIIQKARCTYGSQLELELKNSLKLFVGRQSIRDASRRLLNVGKLSDGRDLVLTGKCDAIIYTDGRDKDSFIPVEIKSRTRVETFRQVIQSRASIFETINDTNTDIASNTSPSDGTSELTDRSVGNGDAMQILCYMAMYEVERAIYVQCARVSKNDPILPVMCDMAWDKDQFIKLKSALKQKVECILGIIPESSASGKLDRTQRSRKHTGRYEHSASIKSKSVRRTRLMSRCIQLVASAGIRKKRCHQGLHRARTRSQTKAIKRAISIGTLQHSEHLGLHNLL